MSLFTAKGLVCYFTWLFWHIEQYPGCFAEENPATDFPKPFLPRGSRKERLFPSGHL